MKKKILSLLLLLSLACGAFAACGGSNDPESTPSGSSESISSEASDQTTDYASSVALDFNSTDTIKQEATVKLYVDGDTTHFYVPADVSVDGTGVLKARYLAIDTPESTGKVEEWGKAASNFTKSKLQSAQSIVLETDSNEWEIDSTGSRHLVWVWYRTSENEPYRNLNIEILQEGYAKASNSGGNRYGTVCLAAISQAETLGLHVYSNEKDPDFYYGDAIYLSMRELRLSLETTTTEDNPYVGTTVAVEGVFTYNSGTSIYLESTVPDEDTGIHFGIYIFYGYGMSAPALKILNPGNHVRVVGTLQYYEAGESYQISGIKYNLRNPDAPDSMKLLDTDKHEYANVKTTVEQFNSKLKVNVADEDETPDLKTFTYAQLALHSSISMKSLKVTSIYTTESNNENSDGAMSITCKDENNNTITVRTAVLKDKNGNVITEETFKNHQIDVEGVIDYYKPTNGKGSYQIRVFSMDHITIH